MSRTTIKSVWLGEKAEDVLTLRNSHGSAPVVWNAIAKQYLGLKDHEYPSRSEELWPLYKRTDMPAHHRVVLLMTYDYAIVMKANYKQAASDIRAFIAEFPSYGWCVNNWQQIAALFDSDPDCPAIGFYWTSVSEDLFQGQYNKETHQYGQPDWSVFWDIYVEAEKWKTDIVVQEQEPKEQLLIGAEDTQGKTELDARQAKPEHKMTYEEWRRAFKSSEQAAWAAYVHNQRLRSALTLAQNTFARYAALHSEKGTPDGDEKARLNHELELQMAAALEQPPTSVELPPILDIQIQQLTTMEKLSTDIIEATYCKMLESPHTTLVDEKNPNDVDSI